jgi:AraC-like DNA-binding protein
MLVPTGRLGVPSQDPSTDSLGCSASKLHTDHELAAAGVRFYRKRTDDPALGQVSTPASGRGFLVGVSLEPGHSRRIVRGRHASSHDFAPDAIYIRRFAEDYKADIRGGFDFLLIELSERCFERAVDPRMGTRVTGLECVTGLPDPVLASLACALVPALERPHEASTLFVDQMAGVIATHLIQHYGSQAARSQPKTHRLSRVQEALAKEMLGSDLSGGISASDVADACQLSRSHFIRSFKEATGQTPHQWLQGRRVERAVALLRESMLPLAEIASLCGFADQSHFTRVFTRAVGTTPRLCRLDA